MSAALLVSELDIKAAPAPARSVAAQQIVCAPVTWAVVRDRAGFDALEAEWNELFEASGRSHQIFLSFNWLWHWCNHYVPADASGRLYILTARRDGRLVMVWPMAIEKAGPVEVLTWMGDPVTQYGDVLVADTPEAPGLLAAAWEYIKRHSGAGAVRLRKVRADAAVAPLLETLGGLITETQVAPYLDLASAKSFAEYETRYSGGARRNRRRLFRRLDEQGAITFEDVTHGPRAREIVALTMELKRRWLAARGLVSKAFADDRFGAFFADVAEAANRPAGCRIAVLKTAGRPVAIEIALRHRDRMALHIIVFDLEFEKSGAGVLLLEQSLRTAADSGVGCYDLLAPAHDYKMGWADGSVEVKDWALPLSAMGSVYTRVYLGIVREQLRRGIESLPVGARQKIAGLISKAISKA